MQAKVLFCQEASSDASDHNFDPHPSNIYEVAWMSTSRAKQQGQIAVKAIKCNDTSYHNKISSWIRSSYIQQQENLALQKSRKTCQPTCALTINKLFLARSFSSRACATTATPERSDKQQDMLSLQQDVQQREQPSEARTHAHWREAFRVLRVRPEVRAQASS